ncbi:MAG TPA: hypothetical protein VI895_06800, partial [Bdellovibrionota bacterium]|nr:hypothetical protein [Bdellovibrionota bacterium]
VGYRFYSDRPTVGFYTTDRALQAHLRVEEFQKFVFPVSGVDIPNVIRDRCGDIAILPSGLASRFQHLTVVAKVEPLVLVSSKVQSN